MRRIIGIAANFIGTVVLAVAFLAVFWAVWAVLTGFLAVLWPLAGLTLSASLILALVEELT